MKTPRRTPLLAASLPRHLVLPTLCLAYVVAPASGDVSAQKPVVLDQVVVDAAKTHTLFMGADISVNLDKSLYPVRNVIGSSWVIVINGKDEVVSAKKAPLNLKITPSLKLTEVAASITDFKRVPTYSYANDPSVMLTRGLSQAASMNADLMAVAGNAQHIADAVANKALGPMALFAASNNQFGAQAIMNTARSSPAITHPGKAIPGYIGYEPSPLAVGLDGTALATQLTSQAAQGALSQTQNSREPTERLVTQGLDAMNVEFMISSARPLHNPYVVTMTRFRTPDAKPGVVQNLVYAQSLDPIYDHPTYVQFTEEGFPFNYELLDFQLHIYDRGVEIATNIASKRVELTRDEAFEYVKMEYVGAHRGETLPASPSMGRLPAELPTRLASGKYAEAFFVKVSKDGLAAEAFQDASCTKKIDDPFLESVVKSIRFKPALSNGKPVDTVASLDLTKLQF